MTRLSLWIPLPFFALLAGMALSQEPAAEEVQPTEVVAQEEEPSIIIDASETDLDALRWLKRPVVVFADSPNDPRFVQQMAFLNDRLDILAERDVAVVTDTNPSEPSAVRQELRARGFMLVVIAKDGSIVTRKPAPWDVREISRSIDKLPLRKQEVAAPASSLKN